MDTERKEKRDKLKIWLKRTLDEKEVKEALDRLERIHPMRKERMFNVFTFLKCMMFDTKKLTTIIPISDKMDLRKNSIKN